LIFSTNVNPNSKKKNRQLNKSAEKCNRKRKKRSPEKVSSLVFRGFQVAVWPYKAGASKSSVGVTKTPFGRCSGACRMRF